MKLQVVVNISRTSIQFFYSQNGNSFKPFKYENQELIPLFVFTDGYDFQVGETAKSPTDTTLYRTIDRAVCEYVSDSASGLSGVLRGSDIRGARVRRRRQSTATKSLIQTTKNTTQKHHETRSTHASR